MARVTTQQVADRADIAIATLYLYAGTKAELLILVQNQKFATAIDDGLAATAELRGTLEDVLALLRPAAICLRSTSRTAAATGTNSCPVIRPNPIGAKA